MKNKILTAETRRRRDFMTVFGEKLNKFIVFSLCLCVFAVNTFAQTETPPKPGVPKSVIVPGVKEKTLPNGLKVAVVERKNVPLVTVNLYLPAGASMELSEEAGLADMTVQLLTKGTTTRSATQIAEEMEFLGGSIATAASWNSANVVVNVMSDKLDKALEIMSDVVLNPTFKDEELDLLKSQTLDGLTFNLKQPGFLANYVAAKYSFGEHPAGGTPASIEKIRRQHIVDFHQSQMGLDGAVLIFSGDITALKANALAAKYFGKGKSEKKQIIPNIMESPLGPLPAPSKPTSTGTFKRILVVDLPKSGQAAVKYLKKIEDGRVDKDNVKTVSSKIFYPASVMNSVLGGGYSSRLNQEIRIKRGLSYGAGSGFGWRFDRSNFATSTQTKNESAAEVAELVLAEVKKLTEAPIPAAELSPRKLVLNGTFGQTIETTGGLADLVSSLYTFDLPTSEMRFYMKTINAVSSAQIVGFAKTNLLGGDIIIVGDYSVFKDDLAKRFPNMQITVVKADDLDLSKDNLQK